MEDLEDLEINALAEIEKLLLIVPKENLLRLKKDFVFNFNPDQPSQCVYGLAYGDCNDKETIKVIKLCCREECYLGKKDFDGDFMLHTRSTVWTSDLENYMMRALEVYSEETDEFYDSPDVIIETPIYAWVKTNLIDKIEG